MFAQENSSESSGGYVLERPVRIELGYVPLLGFDAKGAYMFQINDVLRWDVGVNVNFLNTGLITTLLAAGNFIGYHTEVGMSLNILEWFKR